MSSLFLPAGHQSIDQLLAAEVSDLRNVEAADIRRYDTGVKGVLFLALKKKAPPRTEGGAAAAGKGGGAGGGAEHKEGAGGEGDEGEEEEGGEEEDEEEEGAAAAAGGAPRPQPPPLGPSPRAVVLSLLRATAADHIARSRHCQRVFPVEATCYARVRCPHFLFSPSAALRRQRCRHFGHNM